MANPLQPKCIEVLEKHFNAYVINLVSASRNGEPDLVACINGEFWAFEIKYKTDVPSELQKIKLNKINEAGGRGYFIRSTEELIFAINYRKPPEIFKTSQINRLKL